jgi:ComF family protein
LVPVPLHWTRLAWRSFNQSAVLCHHLAPLTGVPTAPLILQRTRPTVSQGHLTPTQRTANVRGAFKISDRKRHLVQGARVVLVDDVYTTGATVRACAQTLLRGGAAWVSVLTLARVPRPAHPRKGP